MLGKIWSLSLLLFVVKQHQYILFVFFFVQMQWAMVLNQPFLVPETLLANMLDVFENDTCSSGLSAHDRPTLPSKSSSSAKSSSNSSYKFKKADRCHEFQANTLNK